jgi:hypothetical protein
VWKPGKDEGSESCAGIGDGEQEWDLWEFVNIMENEPTDDCASCDLGTRISSLWGWELLDSFGMFVPREERMLECY